LPAPQLKAMANRKPHDPSFEIAFFESVLRRSPDYVAVIEILGGLYTRVGRIAAGLRMDRRLVRLQPANATARYNLACSLALSKRRGDALTELKRAVKLGYEDADWMRRDPDLANLRNHPEFVALLSGLRPHS
jgi:predicted Zn-dependent protease